MHIFERNFSPKSTSVFKNSKPVSAKKSSESAQEESRIIQASRLNSVTIQASPTFSIFPLILWRMCLGFLGGFYFLLAAGAEIIYVRGRSKRMRRRAVRLRETIMWLGGAWVKIGQQLSMRLDMLPSVFCEELSKTLDEVPPMETEVAIKAINEQIQRKFGPRSNIYDHFQEGSIKLIGAGSIGCVYEAYLMNGQKVAIKVRRPRIVKQFSADLKALDWIMGVAEFFTFVRPGLSTHFRKEVRGILLEELNFLLEARYQELFSVYYKKRKKLRVRAPFLYFDYCGEEIVVSEYVSGICLKYLLEHQENPSERIANIIEEYGLSYKVIAKRLIRSSYYGFFECPFFHGDPHPGNIMIQPGNKIVMIDFGACGVFSEKNRNLMRQLHFFKSKEDVSGMVQIVITLMEPLPPIDIESFSQELESAWWQGFYAMKSKHSEWWERTSMRLWLALLNLVRTYRIPIPSNMLSMIRATLLYDTVAARLYPKIEVFDEYQKYYKRVAKRTKRALQKRYIDQAIHGPSDANYLRMDRLLDTADLFVYKFRQYLDQPVPRFDQMTDKFFDVVRFSLGAVGWISFFTITAFLIIFFSVENVSTEVGSFFSSPMNYILDVQNDKQDHLQAVWGIWGAGVILNFITYTRRIIWRLGDKDIKSRSRF